MELAAVSVQGFTRFGLGLCLFGFVLASLILTQSAQELRRDVQSRADNLKITPFHSDRVIEGGRRDHA